MGNITTIYLSTIEGKQAISGLRPHPRFAVMSSCWIERDAAAPALSNFYNPRGTRPTHPDTWPD